jgi:glycosyltransferase involved in cell wall biosynthesis
VVASAVGGIPEIVDHGETGLLVPAEAVTAADVEPRHPEQFARDLAAAVNALLDDPRLQATMSKKARAKVERVFSWASIARQTLDFYATVVARHAAERGITGEGS